jgi:hypothetical protein
MEGIEPAILLDDRLNETEELQELQAAGSLKLWGALEEWKFCISRREIEFVLKYPL